MRGAGGGSMAEQHWIRRLIDLGIDQDTTVTEARYIRLTNTAALVLLAVVIAYIPVFALLDHPIGPLYIGVNMLEATFFTLPPLLNARKRHRLASILLFVSALMLIVVASYMFGTRSGVYFYLLATAPIAVAMLGQRHIWPSVVATMISASMFVWFDQSGPPDPIVGPPFSPTALDFFYLTNLGGTFAMILAYMSLAWYSARRAEQDLTELAAHLEARVAERTRELAETDAQLRQAQKMEAVGRLAGGIAHDFNNTLVIIIGYTELLLTRLPDDAPTRTELLEIRAAAQRAEALTAQLLAIGRHDSGQQTNFDLGELLQRIHGTLQRIIGEEITIALNPPSSKLPLWGDRERLLQALLNLIINARDAMPDGGTLTIRAQQEQRDGVEGARIDVLDTGIGIPEDIRERIFEPFFTTKPTGKGSGLGLALVYTTVRQAGGTIDVSSTPDEGTTFSIWLPLSGDGETSTDTTEAQPRNNRETGELTILLVEDHPDVRQILAESLKDLHHAVIDVDSAATARDIWNARKDEIDLLITDIIMPNERGTTLARDLLADRDDLPVILISGYTNEVLDADLAMRTTFLQKPFDASDLAAAIRRAVPSTLRS